MFSSLDFSFMPTITTNEMANRMNVMNMANVSLRSLEPYVNCLFSQMILVGSGACDTLGIYPSS